MDDIYFSDRRNRRNENDGNHIPKERFSHSDYDMQENPYLKKRSPHPDIHTSGEKFTVNIPDDGFDVYRSDRPVSRTPQGQRKAPAPSRTPSGAKAGTHTGTTHTPIERKTAPQHSAPSHARPAQRPVQNRTPQGRAPQRPPVKPPKPDTKKTAIIAVCSLVAVFILGLFGYGYSILGNIDYDDTIVENAYVDEEDLLQSSKVENILIIGSDEREEGSAEAELVSGQRADTMILFSIDKKNKQIKLTSFLRDSYVYIPSEGYEDKLNAAYSLGGIQLTMDTIEYNFGVKIDSYVTVNFAVFKQFIDLLGGIPVEVADYEAEYMVDVCKYPRTKAGLNQFNGAYALMYCRIRYLDNDLYRTQRQRKVIKAVIGEAAKTNLFKLMSIVKQVVPNIRTDISRNDLISLGLGAAVKFLRYDIVQQQIPANGTWWDETIYGQDVIVFNEEDNRDILEKFIFEKYVEEKSEEE